MAPILNTHTIPPVPTVLVKRLEVSWAKSECRFEIDTEIYQSCQSCQELLQAKVTASLYCFELLRRLKFTSHPVDNFGTVEGENPSCYGILPLWAFNFYFRQANPLYSYEKENANIHHTRLRLGLSHLRSHLFTYNLSNDSLCQQCNLENETIEHYLIRCPAYTIPRIRYLQALIDSYDYNYVAGLSDLDMVDKFLHGDPTLSNSDNLNFVFNGFDLYHRHR